MDFAGEIARFVENLNFSHIPLEGIERAKHCLLDFIRVTAMAAEQKDSTPPIRKAIHTLAGGPGKGYLKGKAMIDLFCPEGTKRVTKVWRNIP